MTPRDVATRALECQWRLLALCTLLIVAVTRFVVVRQVLMEQQSTLRLIQADASHPDAPLSHRSHHQSAAVSSSAYKTHTDLSPWDAPAAVKNKQPPVPLARKSGKKSKKSSAKQQPLEMPPALSALLKTVKQVGHTHTSVMFWPLCVVWLLCLCVYELAATTADDRDLRFRARDRYNRLERSQVHR